MTSPEPTIVALVTDLMDRSRLTGIDVRFVSSAGALLDAITPETVAVVDLGRPGALDALPQVVANAARVVAYAPHVDGDVIDRARALGVDVLPRSRFFRDVAAALG